MAVGKLRHILKTIANLKNTIGLFLHKCSKGETDCIGGGPLDKLHRFFANIKRMVLMKKMLSSSENFCLYYLFVFNLEINCALLKLFTSNYVPPCSHYDELCMHAQVTNDCSIIHGNMIISFQVIIIIRQFLVYKVLG